jgi:hypothetical protein
LEEEEEEEPAPPVFFRRFNFLMLVDCILIVAFV